MLPLSLESLLTVVPAIAQETGPQLRQSIYMYTYVCTHCEHTHMHKHTRRKLARNLDNHEIIAAEVRLFLCTRACIYIHIYKYMSKETYYQILAHTLVLSPQWSDPS